MRQVFILMTLLSFLNSCKAKRGLDDIYPYIITDAYPKESSIIIDTLGHGLYVTVVYDKNGVVKNVAPTDLNENGWTVEQLRDSAISNLTKAVIDQQVKMVLYKTDDSIPFVLFTDSWLSASAITLPKIEDRLKQYLGNGPLFACIPHRDAMLVFPKLTRDQKIKVEQFIREKESGGTKPLSFKFFEIRNNKVAAID